MDVAAFKVSHSIDTDIDATTLPTKSEYVTFQRGAGEKVQKEFKFMNAHIYCHIFADFTAVEVCFGVGAK